MLQVQANPTNLIAERMKHAKWEDSLQHATLKANVEVVNKTKGDEEHTFLMTEHIDENTLLIWAQNMNTPTGSVIYSRSYLISLHTIHEECK